MVLGRVSLPHGLVLDVVILIVGVGDEMPTLQLSNGSFGIQLLSMQVNRLEISS